MREYTYVLACAIVVFTYSHMCKYTCKPTFAWRLKNTELCSRHGTRRTV